VVSLDDFGSAIPPQSIRVLRQYRAPLQYAGDYFLFELHDMVRDVDKWGDLAKLLDSSQANAQGQPSPLARTVLLPMQQICLAFPPDVSDELEDSRAAVERSLQEIVRTTKNTNNAVSTGASTAQVKGAEASYEAARKALNKFYATVNEATGKNVLSFVPKEESEGYPRTRFRYVAFQKGLKVCQGRGGQSLGGVWGGLMVYGYVTDPCGDMKDVESYLYGAKA